MQQEVTSSFDSLSPRAGVCIADGFGIRIFVNHRHLIIRDGLGKHRRERTFARAKAKFKRLVVLGHEGFVTLEAMRWLADLGIAFVQVDHDGKLIGASAPPGNDDARLRRSQALARDTEVGLEVSRWILDRKLKGQHDVLAFFGAGEAQRAVSLARRGLVQVQSTDDLMSTPEGRAAAAYWDAWTRLPIQFVGADRRRIPAHWLTFGARRSSITDSPRLAANPGNAILNYLYRLLEAETRLACIAVGLDPGMGFFHKDKRGRDNLAMDLMEACRPDVDAYALRLFETQLFRASDFHETRKGACRILAPLNHRLSETSGMWAHAAAPVVETVARMLGKPRRIRMDRPLTPLTGANRSRGREAILKEKPSSSVIHEPARPRYCRQCGGVVQSRTRQFCDRCISSQAGGETALRRAASSARVQKALAEWREHASEQRDPSFFLQEVLPLLQEVPVVRMMAATGLSETYCYRIRRSEVVPHARHWSVLHDLAVREAPS